MKETTMKIQRDGWAYLWMAFGSIFALIIAFAVVTCLAILVYACGYFWYELWRR